MSEVASMTVQTALLIICINPLCRWLIDPKRRFSRVMKMTLVMLAMVSSWLFLQRFVETENTENYYQILQISRTAEWSLIRKARRQQSLLLHPDKSSSAETVELFRRMEEANDVLSNKDKRSIYDRLGPSGVAAYGNQLIDSKYLLLQITLRYLGLLLYTFCRTMTAVDDVFTAALVLLCAYLLLEMLLIVQQLQLPIWLLPQYAPFELLQYLRQVYPLTLQTLIFLWKIFQGNYIAMNIERQQLIANELKYTCSLVDHLLRSQLVHVQRNAINFRSMPLKNGRFSTYRVDRTAPQIPKKTKQSVNDDKAVVRKDKQRNIPNDIHRSTPSTVSSLVSGPLHATAALTVLERKAQGKRKATDEAEIEIDARKRMRIISQHRDTALGKHQRSEEPSPLISNKRLRNEEEEKDSVSTLQN